MQSSSGPVHKTKALALEVIESPKKLRASSGQSIKVSIKKIPPTNSTSSSIEKIVLKADYSPAHNIELEPSSSSSQSSDSRLKDLASSDESAVTSSFSSLLAQAFVNPDILKDFPATKLTDNNIKSIHIPPQPLGREPGEIISGTCFEHPGFPDALKFWKDRQHLLKHNLALFSLI